jgi:multiple sugar transport system ATP-binding protein
MASVTYIEVGKTFPDGTRALVDLDLHVNDGEFMVLVGPSGCGKSTALRLLAGLEQASTGELQIDGERVNDMPPQQRNVAMVFQNYALYPHMSVRANLAFPLRMARLSPEETEKRILHVAGLLELSRLLDRMPKQLSGGQRQRVAMGRAIVREPRVFLMDEPLSNLDARLRVQIRAEIAALQARLGVTTLYVTHDQVEAMTLGTRVAVMNAGRLQQIAPPQELYEKPANTFVARFLGSPGMNIFRTRLAVNGSKLELEFAGHWLPVPAETRSSLDALRAHVDHKTFAGIRPEAIEIAEPGAATVALPLTAVEVLGHEQLLYFDLDDDSHTKLIARIPGGTSPAVGDTVPLRLGMDQLYFFDAEGRAH